MFPELQEGSLVSPLWCQGLNDRRKIPQQCYTSQEWEYQ